MRRIRTSKQMPQVSEPSAVCEHILLQLETAQADQTDVARAVVRCKYNILVNLHVTTLDGRLIL